MGKKAKNTEETPKEELDNASAIVIVMDWDTYQLEVNAENIEDPVKIIGLLEMAKNVVLKQTHEGSDVADSDRPVFALGGKGGQA